MKVWVAVVMMAAEKAVSRALMIVVRLSLFVCFMIEFIA